jgi:putative nucleotidyltransferase with HDIG domain
MTSARSGVPQADAAQPTNAASLLRGLVWLRRLVGQYPAGHPLIKERLATLHAQLLRELGASPDLRLDVLGDALLVNGAPATTDPSAAHGTDELDAIGIHSVRFHAGVRPEELLAVAEFLWQFDGRADGGTVAAELARRDVRHISLARIVPLDTRWYARQWPDSPQGRLDPDYEEALQRAQHAFSNVASGNGLDPAWLRDLVHLLTERVARSDVALGHVLAMKQYENLTYAHSVNVAMLSLLIGRKLGLDDATLGSLVEGALLHDIGKTRVSLDVLRKPGILTASERRHIEMHAKWGAEILAELDGLAPLTPTLALEHHRTCRGGGYPDLGDGVIPHAVSQILSVADTYEAVTGARPYRNSTPPERACLILARASGEQLNAAIVKAFVQTITFFPIGSFVRTSRGEVGVVTRTAESDPLHPIVAVLDADLDGVRAVVDTRERDSGGAYERHIVETLAPPPGAPDLQTVLELAQQR